MLRIWMTIAAGLLTTLLAATAASAGSSRILYADADDLDSDIYVVGSDGKGEKPVAYTSHEDHYPSWSPDRRRIAFVRNFQLYVMRADGKGARRVSTLKRASSPSWSPRGGRIAFSVHNRTGIAVFTVRPNGRGLRRVTDYIPDRRNDIFALNPDWSPSGGSLLYDGPDGVVRMRADGSRKKLILPDATNASWSPNGKQLAFERGDRIFLARSNGSDVRPLTGGVPVTCDYDECERTDSGPAWSPSGGRIAYTQSYGFEEGGPEGIHTIKPNGSGDDRVTSSGDSPDW